MYVSRLSRIPHCTRAFSTSASRGALSSLAAPKAEQISANWKGTSATGGKTKNFIGGEFVESNTSEWTDVLDPVSKGLLPSVHLFSPFPSQPKPCFPASLSPPPVNSSKPSTQPHKPSRHGVRPVFLPGSGLHSSPSMIHCRRRNLSVDHTLVSNSSFAKMRMNLQPALSSSKAKLIPVCPDVHCPACCLKGRQMRTETSFAGFRLLRPPSESRLTSWRTSSKVAFLPVRSATLATDLYEHSEQGHGHSRPKTSTRCLCKYRAVQLPRV